MQRAVRHRTNHRRAITCALLAVSFAWTQVAAGQARPAPARAPVLTAPAVLGSTDVQYPAGATGDAVVLLEVTIEKDGTVSSAAVTDGAEPFAEQARKA